MLPLLALVAAALEVPSSVGAALKARLGVPPALHVFVTRSGGLDHVQWAVEGGGTVLFSVGRAAGLRRKVAAEFVLVIRSITRDATLSASWAVPIDTFYARAGVNPSDRVLYLDLLRLPTPSRGVGLGTALVEALLQKARADGVVAVLLVSKQFAGEPSPVAFWQARGFVPLARAHDVRPHPQGRGRPVGEDEVVLMGRSLRG